MKTLLSHFSQRLQHHLVVATHPLNLALPRALIFYFLYQSAHSKQLAYFLSLPSNLSIPPWGLDWISHASVFNPAIANVAVTFLQITAAMACVGLLTRVTAPAAALLSIYVLAIPQMFGKVDHNHHLVWFALLLAFSPSADALSLDALIKKHLASKAGRPYSPVASIRYGVPLRLAQIMVGFIYFFPGLWKLLKAPSAWLSGRAVETHFAYKWAVLGQTPAVADFLSAPVYAALGVAVLIFELGFIFGIFSRFRWAFVLSAFLFHESTSFFMGIRFRSLQLFLLIFVDWHAVYLRLQNALATTARPASLPTIASARVRFDTIVAGALLLTGIVFTGALKIESGWPFACYPAFANSGPTVVSEYTFTFLLPGQPSLEISPAKLIMKKGRLNALRASRLVNTAVAQAAESPEKLKSLLDVLTRHEPRLKKSTKLWVHKSQTQLQNGKRELASQETVSQFLLPFVSKQK